jgi:hypothetical protein
MIARLELMPLGQHASAVHPERASRSALGGQSRVATSELMGPSPCSPKPRAERVPYGGIAGREHRPQGLLDLAKAMARTALPGVRQHPRTATFRLMMLGWATIQGAVDTQRGAEEFEKGAGAGSAGTDWLGHAADERPAPVDSGGLPSTHADLQLDPAMRSGPARRLSPPLPLSVLPIARVMKAAGGSSHPAIARTCRSESNPK